MVKKYVLAAKADISAARKIASQSRRRGFKYTTDVQNAIYSNLATTVSGYGGALTGAQSRQLQALRALKANTAAREQGLAQGAASVVRSQYGSAIAGAVRPATRGLQVLAKAATKTVSGEVGAAGIVARGNEAAQATLGQGVATAQASAQYATAQALEYRAKNDAALIAASKLELDKMVLANKLDLQNYKAKLALEDKASGTAALAIADRAASAAPNLLKSYNTYYDAEGNAYSPADVSGEGTNHTVENADGEVVPVHLPTAGQAATLYINDNGVTDPNEAQFIYSISRAMYGAGAGAGEGEFDRDPSVVMDAINQEVAILYPDYAKSHPDISGLINAQIQYNAYSAAKGAGPAVEDTDVSWLDRVKYAFTNPLSFFTGGGRGSIARGAATEPASWGDVLSTAAFYGIPTGSNVLRGAAKGVSVLETLLRGSKSASSVALALGAGPDAAAQVAEMVTAARAGGPGSPAWDALAALNSRVGPTATIALP